LDNIQSNTLFVGRNLVYLPTCHSTNTYAAQITADNKVFEGTVVLTDCQTAGRGQRGNGWEAEPYQNITLSVVFYPHFLKAHQQFDLNIAMAWGIYLFFSQHLPPERLKIKWSNDIFFEDRKICGMLIENTLKAEQIEKSIVGIGINVNQTQFFYPKATSIQMITKQAYDLKVLIGQLCDCIEQSYLLLQQGKIDQLRTNYLEKLYRMGEKSFFVATENEHYFEGVITGITQEGKLAIETNGRIETFSFKTIRFL